MTTRVSMHWICALVCVLSTGCISTPKYVPPEGPGASLLNRLVEVEDARFFYFFEYAGHDALEPTGINNAPNKTRVILKTNSPYNASYKIAPGPTVVGVRVVYVPSFGRNMFAQMNDTYYHIFVRDMKITNDQLAYLRENLPHVEAQDLSGLRGLGFIALEAHTYLANSRIENGRARIWIEDQNGTVVSPIVTGFGEHDPDISGAFGELMGGHPLVDRLPDPRYGWNVLTSLPDPSN